MVVWYAVSGGVGIVVCVIGMLYGSKCSSLRGLILRASTVVALVGASMAGFNLAAQKLGLGRVTVCVLISAAAAFVIRTCVPWRGIIKRYRLRRSGLRLVPRLTEEGTNMSQLSVEPAPHFRRYGAEKCVVVPPGVSTTVDQIWSLAAAERAAVPGDCIVTRLGDGMQAICERDHVAAWLDLTRPNRIGIE